MPRSAQVRDPFIELDDAGYVPHNRQVLGGVNWENPAKAGFFYNYARLLVALGRGQEGISRRRCGCSPKPRQ